MYDTYIHTSYISSWPNLAVSSWPPPCQELIQTQLGPFVVPSKVQVEEEDFDFEQEESGSQRDWEGNRCGSFEVPYHGYTPPEVCLYLKMDRPEMGHSSGWTWSSSTTSSFGSTVRYFDRWNAADGDLHLEDRRTAETGGTFPCGWTSKDEDVVVNVDMIFAILPPLPCLANCPVRYSMSGGKNHLLAFSTGRLNAAHVNDFWPLTATHSISLVEAKSQDVRGIPNRWHIYIYVFIYIYTPNKMV